MPLRLPFGPNPFLPRQPMKEVLVPQNVLPKKNQIYTAQSPATPIHLSSSLVLASGTNGTPPDAALKNPMGRDMEILEIKFEISGDGDDGLRVDAFGGTIACEFRMGNYKITNGSIPVWNFGRAENIDRERQLGSNGRTYLAYTWRLPRPLFIPAGAVLTPNFTHTALVQDPINVRIGYSARTVVTRPKRLYLPWVAKYVTKAFNPVNDAGVDSSSELDLVNANPEVMYIQRFVGRTLVVNSGGYMQENQPLYFGNQTLNIRITDSYGRPVVRSFTPFRSVFSSLTRSWDLDNGAMLDPDAFYRVDVKVDAITLDPLQTDPANAAGQAFISMVGWREMEAR